LTVKLNTGQSAVVSDINSTCVHRPVIRVLTDEYGMELKSPFDMDLSKNLNVLISKIELGTEEISPITA
jgi:ferredoxin-fold anticodon binding domain-containing protein